MLQIKDVRLEYVTIDRRKVNSLLVLDNVNLEVKDNEFFVIIGPSGCGKSTLLFCVDGLASPSAGEIVLDGRKISEPGPDRAVVFQESSLIPWKSVGQNVMVGLKTRKDFTSEQIEERTARYLQMVNLSDFRNYRPWQLSGGMKQRVGLARALALEPEMLLMDEPFAALDEQTKELLQADLLTIWGRTKQTILYVTHSLDEAIYLADRVGIMSARPSKFKEILEIKMPRPRPIEIKNTDEFIGYRERAWSALKDEVLKARSMFQVATSAGS